MGQSSSSLDRSKNFRRRSIRSSLRSPFSNKIHTTQNTLSAAFNVIDTNLKIEQLNINTASEEELMTLPGITRNIAQNVVEYRQLIGRFKKVEDLALVTGIGAEKLDLIRPEICVFRRKNISCSSSCAQSCDSLPSCDQTLCSHNSSKLSPYGPSSLVDVNFSSVFELMTVPGLNQELAANIVEHRERRGYFSTIDELSKVKGMTAWRLGTIRPYLVIRDNKINQPIGLNCISNGNISGKVDQAKTSNVTKPDISSNGFIHIHDIYDLLSSYSPRPTVTDDFNFSRNGENALRIVSWNLDNLTVDKVENCGVREVICLTILENKFSFIAVQEVNSLSLKKICDELNCPTLKRVVKYRRRDDNEWKCAVAGDGNNEGCLGFLYDSSCDIDLCNMKVLDSMNGNGSCNVQAALASLKFGSIVISLLNVYFPNTDSNCMDVIEDVLSNLSELTNMTIILGDFSGLDYKRDKFEIDKLKYQGVIPVSTCTNSCNTPQCSPHFSDNIFLNQELKHQYTGTSGIIRQGLSHLAIPHQWTWGGVASEHCPVWCELYTNAVNIRKISEK